MNIEYYSLEQLARGYVRDRDVDAAHMHRLSLLPAQRHPKGTPNPFLALLSLWVRFTALLIRYPANPVRVSAQLKAIGFSAAILGASRGIGGSGHVGR